MAVGKEATEAVRLESKTGTLKRMREGISIVFASKTATVGLIIVLFWLFVAVCAPLLTPYTPLEQDWKAPNQGPSSAHILGTDELGRDLWSRLIYGARLVPFGSSASDLFVFACLFPIKIELEVITSYTM